ARSPDLWQGPSTRISFLIDYPARKATGLFTAEALRRGVFRDIWRIPATSPYPQFARRGSGGNLPVVRFIATRRLAYRRHCLTGGQVPSAPPPRRLRGRRGSPRPAYL